MEEAIGSKIADYLNQTSQPKPDSVEFEKNLDHSRLISQKRLWITKRVSKISWKWRW
jgi:hypothetical protein